MEGVKTIKEESVESPRSPSTPPPPPSASTPGARTASPAAIGHNSSSSTATIPSGKENRRTRSRSPVLNTSSGGTTAGANLSLSATGASTGSDTGSSEILTRSRSKVLSKDNSHHSRHHYQHHHRMSDGSKSGGSGHGHGHLRSSTSTPHSPPMPGVKNNSPATISSSTTSHHSQSHNGGREREGHGGFGHKYAAANGDVNTPAAASARNRASPACSNSDRDRDRDRRTPSPPANRPGSANNVSVNNSGSLARTQSSSSNSSGSSSASSHQLAESLAHLTSAGARHVMKIKRFLGTLLHFGCDISPEVGDRVRTLVFNLVSGHLSVEEFHHSLQEVTSFPLRPFVLPFLKTHLPLLQREISQLARISKQTPLSFIRTHEQVIIDSTSNIGEPCDIFHSEATDLVLPGKRKSSERDSYENGEREPGEPGYTSTPKRPHTSLFSPSFFMAAAAAGNGITTSLDLREYYASAAGYPLLTTPTSHHSHSHGHHESSSHSGSGGGGASSGINNNSSGSSSTPSTNGIGTSGSKGPEDEWKNINTMLTCILSMVEKTKRALSILQTRTFHNTEEGDNNGCNAGTGNGNVSSWLRRPAFMGAVAVENSDDFKRQAGEMMAQALRATEDRVAEVKRRAEEAVQEVKRQALVELQRAVAAAEARACEAVANERIRLERAYLESRRAGDSGAPVVAPPMDTETCWNCGRKAHETCSGCNMARYCSSFCQHKDWEHHHTVCGRGSGSSSSAERERERVNGASDSKSCHGRDNTDSPPINVTNPSPDNVSSVGSNN